MLEDRHLNRWQQAGLIDNNTAERIRAFESGRKKHAWPQALAALGIFTIVTGAISVVAANWQNIADHVKLAVDFIVLLLVAAALFIASRKAWIWQRDLLAMLLAGLVLASIALVAQIYQLSGPLWQSLTLWLLVCTPFLALTTRSRLLVFLWTGAVIATYTVAFSDIDNALSHLLGRRLDPTALLWPMALIMTLAAIGLDLASTERRAQAQAIRQALLGLLLVLGTMPQMAIFTALSTRNDNASFEYGALFVLAGLAMLYVLQWSNRHSAKTSIAHLGLIAALSWGISWLLVSITDGDDYLVIPFIAFWIVVAAMAYRAGQRMWFLCAFMVIAFRIVVVYIEAVGGLLATGMALIGGGMLFLALAWLAWRLSLRFAATDEQPS